MLAAGVAKASAGSLSRNAELASHLALGVWAAEEITTGANWFRRLLGVGGAAYALRGLASSG